MSGADADARILERLRGADAPVSGEELADMLRCSRAAVWKRIAALRAQGYRIEARHAAGYVLAGAPDRIALLQQTQETLKTPLSQLDAGDPLANLVRLELAISERLLGNLQSANDFLTLLDKEPNPAEIRLAARAERIRAALDSRDLNAALQLHQQGRSLGTKVAAELDLVELLSCRPIENHDRVHFLLFIGRRQVDAVLHDRRRRMPAAGNRNLPKQVLVLAKFGRCSTGGDAVARRPAPPGPIVWTKLRGCQSLNLRHICRNLVDRLHPVTKPIDCREGHQHYKQRSRANEFFQHESQSRDRR